MTTSRSADDDGGTPLTPGKFAKGHPKWRPGPVHRPIEDRLREMLKVDHETGCHNWTGALSTSGYGGVAIGGHASKKVAAHRLAYELSKGAIPDGLVIDHLCRNKRCCNPDHLEAVTSRENTLRGESFAAAHAKRTHCPANHPYDEQNTRRDNRGRRHCIACIRIREHGRKR